MTRKSKKLTNYNTDIFGKVAFGSICPEVASSETQSRKSFSAYTDKELMSMQYSKSLIHMFGLDWGVFVEKYGHFDFYNAHFILEEIGL